VNFADVAWWGYLLTVISGIAFGTLQSLILKRSVLSGNSNRALYFVKYLLWAAALVSAAFIGIPILIVFTVSSSVFLIILSTLFYRKAQREAH
jgi:hypothetical protein